MPFVVDVAVVGGGYAGLSAALQVARARRRVLVVDAGARRNRFSVASHGFLGHDGRAPEAIAAAGRADLLAYPTAAWLDDEVVAAERDGEAFRIRMRSGEERAARRLVLAGGVVDELPPLEGLAERWGRSVFQCPYCHAYELAGGRFAVLADGAASLALALVLTDWGEVTLFGAALQPAQREALRNRGVGAEEAAVGRVVDRATLELVDGRRLAFDGVFTISRKRFANDLAQRLGCAIDEGPYGPLIRVDGGHETSVRGVFACGDNSRMAGSVAVAVGDGAAAGIAVHQSLVLR